MNYKVTTLSQRLKQVMSDRSIKQKDLVDGTGLSKQQINQYVNGVFNAKPEKLFNLAKFLNVSEQWLMGFDVPMEKTISTETLNQWEEKFNLNSELAQKIKNLENFIVQIAQSGGANGIW